MGGEKDKESAALYRRKQEMEMAARKRAARRTGIDDPGDISSPEKLLTEDEASRLAVWNLEPTRCDRFIPTDHRHCYYQCYFAEYFNFYY